MKNLKDMLNESLVNEAEFALYGDLSEWDDYEKVKDDDDMKEFLKGLLTKSEFNKVSGWDIEAGAVYVSGTVGQAANIADKLGLDYERVD